MMIQNLKWTILLTSALIIFSCNTSEQKEVPTTETTEKVELKTEEKTIEINGVQHYFRIKGSGEPMLILHGGPGLSHNYMLPYFDELAADYQLIFFDQRGGGKTDFPKDTSSINMDAFVEDVEAIRKHFNIEKMALLGHSWGSILALNYAAKYQNHVNQLVLVSPAPATTKFYEEMVSNMHKKRTEEETKELVQIMMSKAFDKRETEAFTKAMKIGDKVNLYDPSRIDELYELHQYTQETATKFWFTSNLMERHFFDYNVVDKIKEITVPTLIVIGDMDNVPFASSQFIADNLENARLEIIKSTGHYPFFEDNKAFTNVLTNYFNPEYE